MPKTLGKNLKQGRKLDLKYKVSNRDVYCNTKIKMYRDGKYTITRCSRNIFKSGEFEYESKNQADIENRFRSEKVKKHLENHVFIFRDDNDRPQQFWDVSKDDRFKTLVEKSEEVRKDSIERAKQSIFDIVYENDWKYFLTITFDGKDFERDDVKTITKKLRTWLNDRVKRKGLKYILVPEMHKKGGIHCHALINDCDLKLVDSGTRLVYGYNKPIKLDTIKKKHLCEKLGCDIDDLRVVYNVADWKYGFSTAIETYGQASNLAFYVTKYITKDVKKIFGKFFWSSKNIRRQPDISYTQSDFVDDLPIVSPQGTNTAYQYESSFTYSTSQQVEKNTSAILEILEKNGLD